MKNKVWPLFLVILAGVLWGCMGIFVRTLNDKGLMAMNIVAVRGLITTVILFLYLLVGKRELFRIRIKDIWCFLGSGIVSVLFFNYCYFSTMAATSLAVAAILLYTSPAIVMVLSFFLFKERFTGRKLIALVLTFAGCVLVSGVIGSGDVGKMSPGTLLVGLGAGLGYALYSIFSRYAISKGYQTLTITFYTFLFSTVGCVFLADWNQIFAVTTGSLRGAIFAVGIAVFGTIIPYLAYTAGLGRMENGKAAVLVSVEPAVATMVSLVVYREPISPVGVLGIVLVLSALVLMSVQKKPKK